MNLTQVPYVSKDYIWPLHNSIYSQDRIKSAVLTILTSSLLATTVGNLTRIKNDPNKKQVPSSMGYTTVDWPSRAASSRRPPSAPSALCSGRGWPGCQRLLPWMWTTPPWSQARGRHVVARCWLQQPIFVFTQHRGTFDQHPGAPCAHQGVPCADQGAPCAHQRAHWTHQGVP